MHGISPDCGQGTGRRVPSSRKIFFNSQIFFLTRVLPVDKTAGMRPKPDNREQFKGVRVHVETWKQLRLRVVETGRTLGEEIAHLLATVKRMESKR